MSVQTLKLLWPTSINQDKLKLIHDYTQVASTGSKGNTKQGNRYSILLVNTNGPINKCNPHKSNDVLGRISYRKRLNCHSICLN